MSGTLQIWNDDENGLVRFRDRNEQLHSKKCRVSDIKLVDRFDRSTGARIRRDIAAEINKGLK